MIFGIIKRIIFVFILIVVIVYVGFIFNIYQTETIKGSKQDNISEVAGNSNNEKNWLRQIFDGEVKTN